MSRYTHSRAILVSGLLAGSWACGGNTPADPGTGQPTTLELTLTGIRVLNASSEGSYEAWVTDASGTPFSAGTFSGSGGTVQLALPVADPRQVDVTIEPPGDTDPAPSAQRLLTGTFSGARATLSVEGAVTQSTLPLREQPGQFTMFSPSDNAVNNYPSHEEAGIWLFNMAAQETVQKDFWVRLTPLREGWVYEGWMVRDYSESAGVWDYAASGSDAIWLSYGKFRPDQTGTVNSRDDDGWGMFSGVLDFQTAGVEEYPGSDWISNPLNLPFPSELTLPLNLRETTSSGQSRWTHVITIEPAWNRGEPLTTERPFLIRPYRDPFGLGAPGDPRTITYHADGVPRGTASLR